MVSAAQTGIEQTMDGSASGVEFAADETADGHLALFSYQSTVYHFRNLTRDWRFSILIVRRLFGEMIEVITPPRRLPTQRRSHVTVQRILDGAESALTRIPLEFVTANRIAKEAGLSVAALYRFFPNKQAVLDAVAMEHLKRIRELLEIRVVAPLERDREGGVRRFNPIEFLESVIDTYIAYLDANVPPGFWRSGN